MHIHNSIVLNACQCIYSNACYNQHMQQKAGGATYAILRKDQRAKRGCRPKARRTCTIARHHKTAIQPIRNRTKGVQSGAYRRTMQTFQSICGLCSRTSQGATIRQEQDTEITPAPKRAHRAAKAAQSQHGRGQMKSPAFSDRANKKGKQEEYNFGTWHMQRIVVVALPYAVLEKHGTAEEREKGG